MSLDILGWGKISDLLSTVINKAWPDPNQQAQAQLALLQLEQQGQFKEIDAQLQMMKAQTDINQAEATNENIFVSGWRPFIGWVGGVALAYQYLLRPLLPWILNLFLDTPVDLPTALDSSLSELVTAMLGIGLFRTVDKAVPHVTGTVGK